MEIDITRLKTEVQGNCDISDASYGGLYSLCGLLLRLRDLYKWEHSMAPWLEPEPSRLMEWIDAREKRWEAITRSDFQSITVGAERLDPFDVTTINNLLRPSGLVYGAGYAPGMKPSFFLAELKDARILGNLRIDIVDRELVRDLFTTPAMRQGEQIFGRPAAMLFFLWDQILEMRPSVKEALIYGLKQHGLDAEALRLSPSDLGPELYRVADAELETWIFHEIGEVREDAFYGHLWHEIVSTYANTPIEILARVIKDLLADTHAEGLLEYILQNRIKSSIAFYVAFMRPFARLIFPEICQAFSQFRTNEAWQIIEKAIEHGHSKAHNLASTLSELHEQGREHGFEWSKGKILSTLIEPLGILPRVEDKDK